MPSARTVGHHIRHHARELTLTPTGGLTRPGQGHSVLCVSVAGHAPALRRRRPDRWDPTSLKQRISSCTLMPRRAARQQAMHEAPARQAHRTLPAWIAAARGAPHPDPAKPAGTQARPHSPPPRYQRRRLMSWQQRQHPRHRCQRLSELRRAVGRRRTFFALSHYTAPPLTRVTRVAVWPLGVLRVEPPACHPL